MSKEILSFECPNCAADLDFQVERKTQANRTHPWAGYNVDEETCPDCGKTVTLQLKGIVR